MKVGKNGPRIWGKGAPLVPPIAWPHIPIGNLVVSSVFYGRFNERATALEKKRVVANKMVPQCIRAALRIPPFHICKVRHKKCEQI